MSAPYDGVPDKGKYATIFSRTIAGASQPVLMMIRSGRTSTLLDPNGRWRGPQRRLPSGSFRRMGAPWRTQPMLLAAAGYAGTR